MYSVSQEAESTCSAMRVVRMPRGFSQSACPALEPMAEEHTACDGTLVHSGMMEVSTLSASQSLTYGLGLDVSGASVGLPSGRASD